MSATLVPLPPPARDPDAAWHDLLGACCSLRREIADTESVREAYAIYERLQAMAVELNHLVDAAATRCDMLLGRM